MELDTQLTMLLMIQAKSINGLTPTESEMLLQWLMDIVNRNHDLQCRLRWNNQNDIGRGLSGLIPPTMPAMD